MPVVIYLHGNSSSRLEGLRVAPELLKRNINLFVIDFPGCGLSEGEYISLGWHEKEDVSIIVDFVEQLPGVSNIGLWGRSMGAATALFFNNSDPRCSASVYDSSFSEFTLLSKELCKKHVKIPDFLINAALSIIKGTIKTKADFDIYKLNPIKCCQNIKSPGFFIHAMNDELIPLDHTLSLFEKYSGEKSLNICEGSHNTTRQRHILEKVGDFFKKNLIDQKPNDLNSTSISESNDIPLLSNSSSKIEPVLPYSDRSDLNEKIEIEINKEEANEG